MSETEFRFNPKSIIIAVAYENAFFITHLFVARKFSDCMCRTVRMLFVEGFRQLSGWTYSSK